MVEEIFNFAQEDVEEDDIMLMDTHDTIYLWVGKDANATEKKEAMTTALVRKKYIFYVLNFICKAFIDHNFPASQYASSLLNHMSRKIAQEGRG